MAPPGMPNTTSTPSRSSAVTRAWAPVIWTGCEGGSASGRRGFAPPPASRPGALAARSRGEGAWPGRAEPADPAREPTVVVWSVIGMLPHLRSERTLAIKNPSCPRAVEGKRAGECDSSFRALGKYDEVGTKHVVHCG